MNRRATLTRIALAAALFTLSASTIAHAQDTVARPWVGVGAYGAFQWPDALATRAAARSEGLPLALGGGLSFRLRMGTRFLLTTAAGASIWSNTMPLGEVQASSSSDRVNYTLLSFPIDVGLRVNVVPIAGPIAVWVGGGGRATVLNWSLSYGSSANGVGNGVGLTLGVWPEFAVEVVRSRRLSVELFARYVFGLVPGSVAPGTSQFGGNLAVGGPVVGLASHWYF